MGAGSRGISFEKITKKENAMHIPDGYLSLQTFIPLYGVSAGIIAVALKKIKKELSHKQIPYLAMAAA